MNEKMIESIQEQLEEPTVYDMFEKDHWYVAMRMKKALYKNVNLLVDGLEEAVADKYENHYPAYCDLIDSLINQGVLDIHDFIDNAVDDKRDYLNSF